MMSGQGGGSGMMGGQYGGGLSSFLGGMFGNSGGPYDDAMKAYQQWMNKAQGVQNPYLQAGNNAIGPYQQWLQRMQDPTKFMNDTMGQYQESPWAKFQQQQGMRAANNIGSATGMTGSTPMMQQAQQNAQNISSGDMQNWLSQVLGINNQYGQGEAGLMGMGQNAANAMSGMYQNMGQNAGQMAYGRGAAKNNDFWNMLGGAGQMLGGGLFS